jgi:hypothetical protein
MGYIAHNAIIVTSWSADAIQRAHAKAAELDCHPTNVTPARVNGYSSFLIPPDGSKEGWADSAVGDAKRNAWVAWAHENRYEDGSTSLHWVEVRYSADDSAASIVRSAWSEPHPKDSANG